jgi:hypothetical protein
MCDMEGGKDVALEIIYELQDFYALYGTDSDSTKLLDHPKTETLRGGGGLR